MPDAASIAASAIVKPAPEETPAGSSVDGKPVGQGGGSVPDPKFAELAAKEKARRESVLSSKAERAKLDQERQLFEAEKAQIAAERKELAEWREWKAKGKASPIEAMKALGLEPADIAKQQLNGGKPTIEQTIAPLAEKLTALEQKLAADKEELSKQAKAQREAEIASVEKRFEEQCNAFVEGNKDAPTKHPLTKLRKAGSLVADTIREHFKLEEVAAEEEGRSPRMLSIQEAADLVEKHLKAEYEEAQKILAPTPAVPGSTEQRPSGDRKTISADLATTATTAAAANKRETPKQRYERMMKQFGG